MVKKLLTLLICSLTFGVVSAQCNELFFSEYLEGASNNKAIEVYNATSATVNLGDYVIYRYNNGSPTPSDSLHMVGTLAPGAVYVAGNPSAVAGILAVSDTLHTITFFNGDDAMSLKNKVTGVVLDIIGIIGNDPGTNWTVGSAGATSEFTIVRMVGVQQGNTNWAVSSANEWDVYAQNTITFLGAHTMTSCVPPVNPVISFATGGQNVTESNSTVTADVSIVRAGSAATVTVDVSVAVASTAIGGGVDYTYTTTTLTWAPTDSATKTVSISLIDDAIVEGVETIELEFGNFTGNSVAGAVANHVINITDNDFPPVPVYPIGTINTTDANGVGDSLAVHCWVHGVVYGGNLRPVGLQFTIIDPTGGIGIFNGPAFPGYTVTEGDSIHLRGTINQFNGLLQMDPDSIVLISSGNALQAADVVTDLDEFSESNLVIFTNAHIINPSQWTGTGSGFNVDVTNGTDTIQIRIDADVNLYSQPAPTGIFAVRGIGGQFDATSPYTTGYQLLPRYQPDIIPMFNLELGPDQTVCANDTTVLDAGIGQGYLWSNGATTQSISVVGGGIYSVTVTDTTFGGTVTDQITLTAIAAPVAAFTANQTSGFDFNFTDGSTGATSWSWNFGDGGTSTAQNPTHTYAVPGPYVVTLTVTGQCGTSTSDTTVIAFVGVQDPSLTGITVYPNPTEAQVRIRFAEAIGENATLSVSDVLGRVVHRQDLGLVQAGSETALEITESGIFFIEVRSTLGSFHTRLIVR